MKNKLATTSTLIALSTLPSVAHAYLDPGSGSMIVQVLIGAVAGSLFLIKQYWFKIKSFFKKKD
jgi:hypothetical protein